MGDCERDRTVGSRIVAIVLVSYSHRCLKRELETDVHPNVLYLPPLLAAATATAASSWSASSESAETNGTCFKWYHTAVPIEYCCTRGSSVQCSVFVQPSDVSPSMQRTVERGPLVSSPCLYLGIVWTAWRRLGLLLAWSDQKNPPLLVLSWCPW